MAILEWAGNLLRRATKHEPPPLTPTSLGDGTLTLHNLTHGISSTLQPNSLISFAAAGRETFRITANNELQFCDDMKTPEAKVKARVVEMLKAFAPDVWWSFPLTGGFGNSGTPDILACCWGHFLAIECKAGNNTPTALQQREIDAIITAGGAALVINESNMENLAVVLAAWNPHNERS